MIDKFMGLNGTHYEMLYSPEVIEKIKEYCDIDHNSDSCLEFIDKYGEADFLEYYDDYLDFYHIYGSEIDCDELISFFSGFSFLYVDFYGAYDSVQDFAMRFYQLDYLPEFLFIDWDMSIDCLKDQYEFVFNNKNQKFLVFGKE